MTGGAKINGLVDATGKPVRLGEVLGKGGEGSVFEVAGSAALVAKVYHQKPLPESQAIKLQSMVSLASNQLAAISAWPNSLIYIASIREPCGILMPRISNARHLHELYGTLSRRTHFPDTAWHHMVLAARNTAAAFHTIQETGVVIGDVNQGNLMVDPEMRVRMIDCDSFQIHTGQQLFHCPVGTPHFTPPELQSTQLRDVKRTINHDGFGLAVLIFHLLFMGRHPFAGRYLGAGDMSIEKAIAERRFAFSKHKAQTQVDPPPASLLLEDLPKNLGELFERAFRSDAENGESRPTPAEWVRELELLLKHRKVCDYDSMHIFYGGLKDCPWCRIEDFGGPTFFVARGGTSLVSKNRLLELSKRVKTLSPARFPDLSRARVSLPSVPALKKKKAKPPLTILDLVATLMAAGAVACLAGVFSPYALLAGAPIVLGAGAILLWGKEAQTRRRTVQEYQDWLAKTTAELQQYAEAILREHSAQAAAFKRSTDELMQQAKDYQAEGKALVKVLIEETDAKKNELLRNLLIRDNTHKIPGMTPSILAILESYGIESAYDVERLSLFGVPMIDTQMLIELMTWREEVEHNLVIKPDHGVTAAELEQATEVATQRYKLSQARRVLMGASRLESVAKSAARATDRELLTFDGRVSHWREIGKQLRDYQNDRRWLERTVNASPASIVTVMTVAPLLGTLVWWLIG